MQNIIHSLPSGPTTRLPVQAANCLTVLFFCSDNCKCVVMFPSCETQSSLLLAARRTLASLWRFTDVWLHKTNVSLGKSCKQPLPSRLSEKRTHSCLHITQPPKNVLMKTTIMSKLVAFEPNFNLRLINTACTSNTFSSVTSQAQLVSGCGDSA